MKRKCIAILCAALVVIATLSPSIALVAGAAENAGMSRVEQLKRTSYPFLYFYNLEDNFSDNAVGTCGYVAMAMLLSYYDCFWDDNLVPDEYMTSDFGPENEREGEFLSFYYRHYSSPGSPEAIPEDIRDDLSSVWDTIHANEETDETGRVFEDEKNMIWSIYQHYSSQYSTNSLHSLLIDLLEEQNSILSASDVLTIIDEITLESIVDGNYDNVLSDTVKATLSEPDHVRGSLPESMQRELVLEYLQHVAASNESFNASNWTPILEDNFIDTYTSEYDQNYDPVALGTFETNHDYLRYKVIEYIKAGIPVFVTIEYKDDRTDEKCDSAHCAIAYDYDEENDIIYVHSGWQRRAGSYYNINSFGYDTVYIRSYLVLEYTGEHVHSNNYYFDDTPSGVCSCQLPNHQHEHTYMSVSSDKHRQSCWCGATEELAHRFKAQGLNQAVCIDCGFVKIVGLDTPIVSPLNIDLPPAQNNTSNEEEKKE